MIDVMKMAGVVACLAGAALLVTWWPWLFGIPVGLLIAVLWFHS